MANSFSQSAFARAFTNSTAGFMSNPYYNAYNAYNSYNYNQMSNPASNLSSLISGNATTPASLLKTEGNNPLADVTASNALTGTVGVSSSVGLDGTGATSAVANLNVGISDPNSNAGAAGNLGDSPSNPYTSQFNADQLSAIKSEPLANFNANFTGADSADK